MKTINGVKWYAMISYVRKSSKSELCLIIGTTHTNAHLENPIRREAFVCAPRFPLMCIESRVGADMHTIIYPHKICIKGEVIQNTTRFMTTCQKMEKDKRGNYLGE